MFVGLDDTDSNKGMCTTFLCKMIIDELKLFCDIKGFPRLIRLNPNIPYKTRGNGALSFEVDGDRKRVIKIIKELILCHHMDDPNTNPGVVLVDGEVPAPLKDFYIRALHEHIDIDEARIMIDRIGAWSFSIGNGRGLIGALASIGAVLDDYTYELIAYRMPEKIGSRRIVDEGSVKEMDRVHFPVIFDSYDWHNRYIAIAPNSLCPVLYGIRGNDWRALEEASRSVVSEPVYTSQIFTTNQATDAHIVNVRLADVKEYMSVKVVGKITEKPHYEHKGHLFFKIADNSGDIIVAAYEPTKEFRNIVSRLEVGDKISAWGGVKRTDFGLTLNLEKMAIDRLAQLYENIVPVCCGRKMQSIGKDKGYRCRECGGRLPPSQVKKKIVERNITEGLYEVPVIARRHLAKPISRI